MIKDIIIDINRTAHLVGRVVSTVASRPTDRPATSDAKWTCKNCWRPILSEAASVDRKHLMTQEPGIWENQTSEMHVNALQLMLHGGSTAPIGRRSGRG